ncbi:MAG: hypothetical protein AAF485_21745 [Chloroflexota bacterium]
MCFLDAVEDMMDKGTGMLAAVSQAAKEALGVDLEEEENTLDAVHCFKHVDDGNASLTRDAGKEGVDMAALV